MRAKTLAEYFSEIEGARRTEFAHRRDLVEMLVITTCAIFSEVKCFDDVARWTQGEEAWLRRFLTLKNGIASAKTLGRVFCLLEPQSIRVGLPGMGGIGTACVQPDGNRWQVPARFGRRRARSAVHGQRLCHLYRTFALGREAVADKSNEITSIPALLEALAIKGCLVSIDAMSCQKEIAGAIRRRGADYPLAVKNNQPSLRAPIEEVLADAPALGFTSAEPTRSRAVVQHVQVIASADQIDLSGWPEYRRLWRVVSLRVDCERRRMLETRYYNSLAELDHEALFTAVRQHLAIENQLHWSLDVIFREDASKIRKDHGPRNIALIRKISLNVPRRDTARPKVRLKRRRNMAGWDDDERMRLLGITPL